MRKRSIEHLEGAYDRSRHLEDIIVSDIPYIKIK